MSVAIQEWINETDAAVDEKLGLIAVKLPFVFEPQATKIASLRHALTFVPDDVRDLGLPLVKRVAKERPDGTYGVTFEHEGHFTPDNANGEEFSLEGTTTDDPIEAHPEIQMLLAKYKGERKDDGTVVFQLTISINGEDQPNPLHGIKTYLVPGLVWSRMWVAPFFPDAIVRALGCIDTPPVGRMGQHPPVLDGDRQWVKMRVKADWRGNIWKISESWIVSGPNGLPPDVYRYRR